MFMSGDELQTKQVRYKLKGFEQILLQRYKEAEAQEPNFIENGNSLKYLRDVFFFVYYAGHGCADVK